MTGVKGVYRHVHLHALNLRETAIRHAASMGRRYEDCNFVVCHIGGGISISAHQHGRMIDGNDIVGGEGPMTPTLRQPTCRRQHWAHQRRNGCGHITSSGPLKNGGFVNLLRTNDARRSGKGRRATLRLPRLGYPGLPDLQVGRSHGRRARRRRRRILLGGGMGAQRCPR